MVSRLSEFLARWVRWFVRRSWPAELPLRSVERLAFGKQTLAVRNPVGLVDEDRSSDAVSLPGRFAVSRKT
jgi:hypothetical protein